MKNLSRLLVLSFIIVPILRADVASDTKAFFDKVGKGLRASSPFGPTAEQGKRSQEALKRDYAESARKNKEHETLKNDFHTANRELMMCKECSVERENYIKYREPGFIPGFGSGYGYREYADFVSCLKSKCPVLYEKVQGIANKYKPYGKAITGYGLLDGYDVMTRWTTERSM